LELSCQRIRSVDTVPQWQWPYFIAFVFDILAHGVLWTAAILSYNDHRLKV